MYFFAISHPNFYERFKYIRDHLGVITKQPWEVVGVDGRDLAKSPDFVSHGHSSDLTQGQIGCALAHCRAYERMLQLDLNVALIVEDDVKLPENIDTIVAQLEKLIRPGEVISLHNPMMEKNRFSSLSSDDVFGMKLLYPMSPRSIRSASAYIITRDAATRILSENVPVKHVADHWDAFWEKGLVRSYRILHPSPCRWLPFESSIGYRSRSGTYGFFRTVFNRNKFLNLLVRLRRKYIFWRRLRNVELVNEVSPLTIGDTHP